MAALLGVEARWAAALAAELTKKEDNEIIEPGLVRISLPYYASSADVAFVAEAVAFIAQHGWKFVPQYVPDPRSGEWRHAGARSMPCADSLADIDYSSGEMRVHQPVDDASAPATHRSVCEAAGGGPARHSAALAEAHARASAAVEHLKLNGGAGLAASVLSPSSEAFRWFLMPAEAAAMARGTQPTAESHFWPPVGAGGLLLQQRQPPPTPVAPAQVAPPDTAALAALDKRRYYRLPWMKPREKKHGTHARKLTATAA